jgi:predicted DNA-binding protein
MHQTTIRFGHELWEELETAAEEGGVSVAQYVREAAIERLVRRGEQAQAARKH